MILAALMFVFGAWNVQQLAQLPSVLWLLYAVAVSILIFFTQSNTQYIEQHPWRNSAYFHTPKLLRIFVLNIATFLCGLIWASSFALWRMGDELPHEWEQKTIVIVGVVASVPEATEHGVRFRFDIERVLTKQAIVPKHSSLSLYGASKYGSKFKKMILKLMILKLMV